MADYITKAEFDEYKENVRQTIEAMKAAYDSLVAKAHDKHTVEAA